MYILYWDILPIGLLWSFSTKPEPKLRLRSAVFPIIMHNYGYFYLDPVKTIILVVFMYMIKQ